MKFFIFTCLLATALAKPKTEQRSSSEESVSISQENIRKNKNLAVIPNEIICSPFCKETTKNTAEMASFSSLSSEEFAKVPAELTVEEIYSLKQLNKKDQFYQKSNFPLYVQALYQRPVVMKPWNQIQTRPYPIAGPTLNREQLAIIEDIVKKTSDMESTEIFTEKTKMDEVQKVFQNLLNKIQESYRKFFWPQDPERVDGYLKVAAPWGYINPNAGRVNTPLRY